MSDTVRSDDVTQSTEDTANSPTEQFDREAPSPPVEFKPLSAKLEDKECGENSSPSVANWIIAISAALGTLAACAAVLVYFNANFNAKYDRLETRDREIAQLIVEKPHLGQVYAYPEGVNTNPSEAIRKYLIRRIGPELTEKLPEFSSVREFSCLFWSDDFDLDAQTKLMDHYFIAEYHSILMYDVWYGFRPEDHLIFRSRYSDVYNLYWSYADEVGTDFLFLTSVFELARFGYYDPDFSHKIRERILEDTDRQRIASVYFSEFGDPEWWKKVVDEGRNRKGDFDPCEPLEDTFIPAKIEP